MRKQLGLLDLRKIIVHEIPLRKLSNDNDNEPLKLSEAESIVSDEVRNYFREKLIKSLANSSYDVVFDPDAASKIPEIAKKLLNDPCKSFVKDSCDVGRHLHESQTGVNKASLLVVAQAKLGGKCALAILKLEKEAGLRLRDVQQDGKRTYQLQHLSDLMLGEKTKVFKAGLFRQKGSTLKSINGMVSDNQRSYTPSIEVANFFLHKFLGCKLLEAADVSTKRFFEAVQQYINDEVADPKKQAKYQIALMAEMNSQGGSISPELFAKNNLDAGDRKAFVDSLQDAECPVGTFDKDATLIASHLHRIQMEFKGGIAVLGTPKAFDENVEMKNMADGRTRVEITDVVRKFKGR